MKPDITGIELKQCLDAGKVVVIDVMTPEDFEACHIAGARNACVYEMAFLDRVAECGVSHKTAIVVYDASGATRTAGTAREKLIGAGYRSVSILSGGLAAWRSAGYPVEGVQPAGIEAARLRDGNYAIDRENSRLEWIGRNINNRHCGRIAVRGGELIVSHEIPVRGRIEIDMTAISNLDLQEEEWRDLLIRHLRSDDFFDVDRFPTATFELTGWESLAEASPGAHNGIATGSLTIKDTTLPITFQAIISPQEDGSIKAHALFEIDRALWNVCYGSGKLYERLGMHFVHDLVTLELFIVAK